MHVALEKRSAMMHRAGRGRETARGRHLACLMRLLRRMKRALMWFLAMVAVGVLGVVAAYLRDIGATRTRPATSAAGPRFSGS